MNKYLLHGNDPLVITIPIDTPFADASGYTWIVNKLSPQDGTPAFANGSLVDVDGVAGIRFTVDPSVVGIRSLFRLHYENQSGTIGGNIDFLVVADDTLVVGKNSFLNYYDALVLADEISGLQFLKGLSQEEFSAALVTAYETINTMVFVDSTGEHYELGTYDEDKLNTLDPGFLRALRIAQLIEANEMSDINSIHYKRLDGLMSETIGESSMMFRPGNIQNFAVTRRSMTFLRNYILLRARLARV